VRNERCTLLRMGGTTSPVLVSAAFCVDACDGERGAGGGRSHRVREPHQNVKRSAGSLFGLRVIGLAALLMSGCATTVAPSASGPGSPRAPSLRPEGTAAPTSVGNDLHPMTGPVAGGPYEPSIQVLVTGDAPTLPAGCRPWHAAGLVHRFLDSVNSKDPDGIAQTWGLPTTDSGEQWYSITEGEPSKGGTNLVAKTQQELLTYFAGRFDAGEQLNLVMADVARAARSGRAAMSFVVTRDAVDLEPGLGGPNRLAQGKAEIDCQRQVFVVWSMAQNVGTSNSVVEAWPCPKPSDWLLGTVPVVCARPTG
jgi:hypothetical protein